MEVFLIGLAVIAGAGVAFFLFVIEPRRKIYDYRLAASRRGGLSSFAVRDHQSCRGQKVTFCDRRHMTNGRFRKR
jgi:hypothetical protein